MERPVRKLKVNFNTNGNGFYTPKISMPLPFLTDMKVTDQDRLVQVEYDEVNKQIIIKKAE